MPHALEVRGLAKRFTVGVGSCLATAEVLKGVDLIAATNEVVAIIGSAGAGKSTLLLCLAGLLAPERGDVRWFGDPSRAAAARRVVYHVARNDLMRAGSLGEPKLHLVDATGVIDCAELDRWIELRRDEGHAIVVAAREESRVRPLASRILRLHRGVLQECSSRPNIRVAEQSPERAAH